MSDPSDNRPVAPPRSLAQPVDQSGARSAPDNPKSGTTRWQPKAQESTRRSTH